MAGSIGRSLHTSIHLVLNGPRNFPEKDFVSISRGAHLVFSDSLLCVDPTGFWLWKRFILQVRAVLNFVRIPDESRGGGGGFQFHETIPFDCVQNLNCVTSVSDLLEFCLSLPFHWRKFEKDESIRIVDRVL